MKSKLLNSVLAIFSLLALRPVTAQDSLNVTKLGELLLDGANDVQAVADYAYVIDALNGLHILDISDPASPYEAGNCQLTNLAGSLFISGDYAYIADGYTGLVVVDISNPASPTVVGEAFTAGEVLGVVVAGDYAYIVEGG